MNSVNIYFCSICRLPTLQFNIDRPGLVHSLCSQMTTMCTQHRQTSQHLVKLFFINLQVNSEKYRLVDKTFELFNCFFNSTTGTF